MNRFQRKNPRITGKNTLPPFAFRIFSGNGPYRAWKNSDYKVYPMITYNYNSINLSLFILDSSIVSGSTNPKLRKRHIYLAAKMMKLE